MESVSAFDPMDGNIAGATLTKIIEDNTFRAAILHQLGISFYEYQANTLMEVCEIKGIRIDHVLRELNSPAQRLHPHENLLITYPAELIISCLKHAHGILIRHKLPYINSLIKNFKSPDVCYHQLAADLKLLFPVFVQDFVEHIHMEEDNLFDYINTLALVCKRKISPYKIYLRMERESINRFITEHEVHDDEMDGIRKITNNYHLTENCPLLIRVLFNELQLLESDLREHARIENEILFPKAVSLESRINRMIREFSQLN